MLRPRGRLGPLAGGMSSAIERDGGDGRRDGAEQPEADEHEQARHELTLLGGEEEEC